MMQINLSLKTQWKVDEVNYVQSGALGRPALVDKWRWGCHLSFDEEHMTIMWRNLFVKTQWCFDEGQIFTSSASATAGWYLIIQIQLLTQIQIQIWIQIQIQIVTSIASSTAGWYLILGNKFSMRRTSVAIWRVVTLKWDDQNFPDWYDVGYWNFLFRYSDCDLRSLPTECILSLQLAAVGNMIFVFASVFAFLFIFLFVFVFILIIANWNHPILVLGGHEAGSSWKCDICIWSVSHSSFCFG